VSVVDGATHAQNVFVESSRGSLKYIAEAFVLFLHGVQLVMRSSGLTVAI
jgi:hypothetical protein